jgi:putative transposase
MMAGIFLNKFRIPSARLQNWDYGWKGIYYITICTKGRNHYFGKITEIAMELSDIGMFAQQLWSEIPNHFPFVDLDSFVVMPNHIHGILIIDKNDKLSSDIDFKEDFNSAINDITPGQKRFRNPGKDNISSIIGSYKSAVSKKAHPLISCFDWQTRFYDHIIQSDTELDRIRQYIKENPAKWINDKYFGVS